MGTIIITSAICKQHVRYLIYKIKDKRVYNENEIKLKKVVHENVVGSSSTILFLNVIASSEGVLPQIEPGP